TPSTRTGTRRPRGGTPCSGPKTPCPLAGTPCSGPRTTCPGLGAVARDPEHVARDPEDVARDPEGRRTGPGGRRRDPEDVARGPDHRVPGARARRFSAVRFRSARPSEPKPRYITPYERPTFRLRHHRFRSRHDSRKALFHRRKLGRNSIQHAAQEVRL